MARLALLAVLLAASVSALVLASPPELSSYKLGAGDVISIRVLGEDDLKREHVKLSDAGTISLPVLGEMRVKGMTVGTLEDTITAGLKGRYLLNPQVTVSIDEYRNFYVNGMVEKPGGYPYSPGLTVRRAISVAGGFRERAARDKISVIHDDDPKQTPHKVDLNTALLPGDVLTIEESFF